MQIHPPLIELFGGRWSLDAPAAAAAWSDDGSVAAFGLRDGSVVLPRAAWPGGPETRARAMGGIEVHPPTVPNPPVSRLTVHKGACLALVADGGAGFKSGGADGRVVPIGIDGNAGRSTVSVERRVDLLTVGSHGRCAGATGREVIVTGLTRQVLTFPNNVTALAFEPSGHRLAVGYRNRVSIWSDDSSPMRSLSCRGRPRVLAWSPDGACLSLGSEEGGVRGWRLWDGADLIPGGHSSQASSLSFSADGALLAASGAARVRYWRLDAGRFAEPGECGLPSSRAPVCCVACHPTRPIVAAGYTSGAVLLCQPGCDDVLLVKGAGGGAVLTFAWSRVGGGLALATHDGDVAIVLLPDGLFRTAAPNPTANLGQPPVEESAA